MRNFFARRTSWNLTTNRYTEALEAHRRAGREVLDLDGLQSHYHRLALSRGRIAERALPHREALPTSHSRKGCCGARGGAAYYAEHGKSGIARRSHPDHQHQRSATRSSSGCCAIRETRCWFRRPSYPLFDFLADIQDVKLLAVRAGIRPRMADGFSSLQTAMQRAHTAGSRCRAVLAVHPNNPTGSYVKAARG